MSFVVASPELMGSAAQDLANIRSALGQATAGAAPPTIGVVAAAEDEVSIALSGLFGNVGQEFQVLSAQALAFHEQFANLLNAGAGAYISTEVANAQQTLSAAVNGPAQTLLGRTAAGQSGGAASVLSGQIGSGVQAVSGAAASVPASLGALETTVAPALLGSASSSFNTFAATVAGPYETLFANTQTNLQALGSAISANPAPFLHQFITNQVGYVQTIAKGVEYVVQNLPTLLANLPANIQAAVQALLAFDPGPYVQQFITNQIAYAHIIATSLQNAADAFGAGLQALPTYLQSAVQALQAGNISGAVNAVTQGFVNLFFTGFHTTSTGSIPGTIIATTTPTGALGDLLPILTIPGLEAQNLTNLLPSGSIAAQISQNATNVIDTVTDTSIVSTATFTFSQQTLTGTFGLPVALAFDAVGAPVNAVNAFGSSTTAFVNAVQTGNWSGAAAALIDGPAVVTDAFLNGQSTLPLGLTISGYPAVINLPLNGILVPTTPYTASISGLPIIGSITLPVGGTPLSGIVPGLLSFLPEELAAAIAR